MPPVAPSQPRLIDSNEFFHGLFRKFDKALNTSLESFRKTINVSMDKMESRIKEVDTKMHKYIKQVRKKAKDEVDLAEVLVNKELRSKIILSQWTNTFLTHAEQDTLDPITFSITRMALNISLCYSDVTPEYILSLNIHKHMLDYVSMSKSFLIAGPCLLAVFHMSLYPQLKEPLILAEVLPLMLRLMVKCRSKPILTLCAKICSSLALDYAIKPMIARSGCCHALFDLVLGNHVDIDVPTQVSALTALVNSLYKNDSNRILAIELNGIKPLLTLCRSTSEQDSLVLGARCLANISFGNPYTSNCILVAGGGEILVELLEACDSLRQPLLVHSVLTAFANICNSEANQTHLGNVDGLVEAAIRICEYSRALYVVTEAANFLVALCWKNDINKARVAHKGCVPTLLKRIIRHVQQVSVTPPDAREHSVCAERLCIAMSTVLLFESNHEQMLKIGGLDEAVRLCKVTNDPIMLQSLGKIIIPMVPAPETIILYHKDSVKHPIEKVSTLAVLKKIKLKGFADLPEAPKWLEDAIMILDLTDSQLMGVPPLEKKEFVELLYFCKEFVQEVRPDTTIFEIKDFRGFLFSIY